MRALAWCFRACAAVIVAATFAAPLVVAGGGDDPWLRAVLVAALIALLVTMPALAGLRARRGH